MARVRRRWTAEEDTLLRAAVTTAQAESRPLLWRKLAKNVPGRTNKDCRRRWWNTLANGTARRSWSEEEDERLLAAVSKYGPNWIKVSCDVGSRSADQCSNHWSQTLDPSINYCDWTAEEDGNLLHEVLTYGTNWATIAGSHRPNRTTLALRNRYSTLRLQNNNNNQNKANADATKKRPGHLLSISETGAATTTPAMEWNLQIPRSSGWKEGKRITQLSDEDEYEDEENEDEENEDEENEEEDEEEGEEGKDQSFHQNSNPCRVEAIPNFQGANDGIGARSIQTPDSNLTSWDTWAARSIPSASSVLYSTQPLSTDNPVAGRADHVQYQTPFGLSSTSQHSTPDESCLYRIPEADIMSTSVSNTIYDTGSIDMDLTASPGTFRTFPQPTAAPSSIGSLTGADASPTRASSADLAASKGSRPSASTSAGQSSSTSLSSAQSSDAPSTPKYQVSIGMACTRAQLDANMVLLAGMGTSLTIQIDLKS